MNTEMTYAQYRGATYRTQCTTWKLAASFDFANANLRCLPAYRSPQGLIERRIVAQAARLARARQRGLAIEGTEASPLWFWAFTGPAGTFGGQVFAVDVRDALVKCLTATVGDSLFAHLHGIPVEVVDSLPGNRQPKFEVAGDWGRLIGVRAQDKPTMYASRDEKGLYSLRQERYREQLLSGAEHPHDVCAVATSAAQLHEMTVKHWPDADFSAFASELK